MFTKLIISLAIINFIYISSTNCYVASNYPREDVGRSAGGQRGVKGGSRRGNVIETTTSDGINNGNTEYNPYGVRPSNSRSEDGIGGSRYQHGYRPSNSRSEDSDGGSRYQHGYRPSNSRSEDNAGSSRYSGYGVRDRLDTSAAGQRQDSNTDGQNQNQDRTLGRYDSSRGSSFRQDSNEFSRNDYRGHRGRTEGNDDLNTGYRGYGRVDASDSRHNSGYRGSGSNPELSSGSFRVDGNSRFDESRTSGQRVSSDTDVPVPTAGVKTKTKRINYIGQGEPGIHY